MAASRWCTFWSCLSLRRGGHTDTKHRFCWCLFGHFRIDAIIPVRAETKGRFHVMGCNHQRINRLRLLANRNSTRYTLRVQCPGVLPKYFRFCPTSRQILDTTCSSIEALLRTALRAGCRAMSRTRRSFRTAWPNTMVRGAGC